MYVLQTFSGNCALTQRTNLICQASSYCLTELILRLLFKWFKSLGQSTTPPPPSNSAHFKTNTNCNRCYSPYRVLMSTSCQAGFTLNITKLPVQNNLPKHTSRGPGTLLKSRVVTAEVDLVHLFSFILLQFVWSSQTNTIHGFNFDLLCSKCSA